MPITVSCECGQSFETAEANAGRLARCSNCGRDLIVPKLSPSDDDVVTIGFEPEPQVSSGKANASLAFGVLFLLAFLAGIPAILFGCLALSDIRQSGGRLKGRGKAIAGIVLGVIACLLTPVYLISEFRATDSPARRSQCTNNLKQIGLAFHNYHLAYDCLPPAAITDKSGRPLLSWRVAILPYMEQSELYNKFHLDEPWDSPHNLTLLDEIPQQFACPSDNDREKNTTGYQVIVGRETPFTPDFKLLRFADIEDGLSNTILVGETRRCVPWTKPEDIPFDTTLPLHGLGSHHGYHNNGFNVLLMEGSVKFAKNSISAYILRRLLTRAGGEAIPGDTYSH